MEFTSFNPRMELQKVENINCLRFTFRGSLVEKDAKLAIDEWKRVFESKDGEKFALIWECNKMTAYDPGAMKAWQRAMKDLRDQTSCIWVISKSSMIRNAVRMISMITNFSINVVRSEIEVQLS